MTNADKYLKDGVSEYDFTEFVFNNGNIYCEAGKADECYIEKLDLLHLLQQPVQPTLTEDERAILRNIDIKNYDIIGKNSLGVTFITSTKDSDKFIWVGNVFAKKLFQFIKERRRI